MDAAKEPAQVFLQKKVLEMSISVRTELAAALRGSLRSAQTDRLAPPGYLWPEGTGRLRKAWNEQTVRTALEPYGKYMQLFDQ